jgi:hypothetical protein
MRTKVALAVIQRAVLLALLSTINLQPSAWAQGTAFTYQGRLNHNGALANGSYDLQFALFDAPAGGNLVGSALTTDAVAVSNGLFTVMVDFGAGAFTGANRWLDIAVRTNGAGVYTNLTPRQPTTATPYAVFARNVGAAGISGTIPAGSLGGAYGNAVTFDNAANSFSGNGGGLSNVNAATLGTLSAVHFWQLGGNTIASDQFLGGTNNQALELRVNGTRALRLEPNTNGAPNVIGGSPANQVEAGVIGATIGGGGATDYFGSAFSNRVSADLGVIGGGARNVIEATAASIGGGFGNTIELDAGQSVIVGGGLNTLQSAAYYSTIVGGGLNTIQANAYQSVIAGGYANVIQADAANSSIGGGFFNTNGSAQSFIAGGLNNVIGPNASSSSIGGGWLNLIQDGADQSVIAGGNAGHIQTGARESFIGGGFANTIQTNAANSFIGGGAGNGIGTNSGFSTIAGGSGNSVQPNAPLATIAGGGENSSSGYAATVGGGANNSSSGSYATVGGGASNTNLGGFSTVSGGILNTVNALSATVGGGEHNTSSGSYGTVPGGANNTAGGLFSFAAGRGAKALHSGTFVWADSTGSSFTSASNDQFLVRAANGVGINKNNPASALDVNGIVTAAGFSTDGALVLRVNNSPALRIEPATNASGFIFPNVISGYIDNLVSNGVYGATIAGGGGEYGRNAVGGNFATVGGGAANASSDYGATVAGGVQNTSSRAYATVGGGYQNTSSDFGATVGGGYYNLASKFVATVAGGVGNTNTGVGATVSGGYYNLASNATATVSGGTFNTSGGPNATVGGGDYNTSGGRSATVGGGEGNSSSGNYATVPGGAGNTAGGDYSLAVGYRAKAIHPGAFVWADSTYADFASTGNDQFLIRASGGVGLNKTNPATALDVSGTVTATGFSGNGAGLTSLNAANLTGSVPSASLASVPAASLTGTIADARLSGNLPLLNASQTFTGVNQFNTSVGIGIAPQSTLHVNGTARIQGANNWDVNNGEGDFRVGNDVQRFKIGVAIDGGGAGDVWMRAQGGTARVFIKTPGGTTFYSNEGQTMGVTLVPGDGAWTTVSDRNAKENFAPANPREVLAKVAALPVGTWNYRAQDIAIRHIGPMAQDFKAAFGVGGTDKGITTVDADGVALAAIQGLNQKVDEHTAALRRDLEQTHAENAELKARLERLERLLKARNEGGR